MEEEKLIHTFSGGFSGSKVQLFKSSKNLFVRKTGDIERNYERMSALYEVTSVPQVFRKEKDVLDMEYIIGLDMDTYLSYNPIEPLVSFLIDFIKVIRKDTTRKDYTEAYEQFAKIVDQDIGFDFSYRQLLEKLPRYLPQTKYYHGDMTLENIIYNEPYFVFIDPVQTAFDSWVFDLAKIRQDLECGWFTRTSGTNHRYKTRNIQRQLLKRFPLAKNDYLLILMLLRVYRHTEFKSPEADLLQQEANRLWKQNA